MPRRKAGEPAKVKKNYTLDPRTIKALEDATDATGINMSQLIEMALTRLFNSGELDKFKRG